MQRSMHLLAKNVSMKAWIPFFDPKYSCTPGTELVEYFLESATGSKTIPYFSGSSEKVDIQSGHICQKG